MKHIAAVTTTVVDTAAAGALGRCRPRNLALALVDDLSRRMRDGRLAAGDKLPSESTIMAEFGVSRTVVREAISKLQAAGTVDTRHGIGSFVLALSPLSAPPEGFRIGPEQTATQRDVLAVLELRIGVETEAASLAAMRRQPENLAAMRAALDAMATAVEAGQDAVAADFRFHLEVAHASQNPHFARLMGNLGHAVIPRARLDSDARPDPQRQTYLRRVQIEHESIFDAIAAQDTDAARAAMRTHLANSRERRRKAALAAASALAAGHEAAAAPPPG